MALVQEEASNEALVLVCYDDNGSDDPYSVRVDLAFVDENFVFGVDQFRGRKVGGGVDSVEYDRPTNTAAVLTGFELRFASGDRDIRKFLVELNQDGRLFVNLADQTANDDYVWAVNVAYIGAEL